MLFGVVRVNSSKQKCVICGGKGWKLEALRSRRGFRHVQHPESFPSCPKRIARSVGSLCVLKDVAMLAAVLYVSSNNKRS